MEVSKEKELNKKLQAMQRLKESLKEGKETSTDENIDFLLKRL